MHSASWQQIRIIYTHNGQNIRSSYYNSVHLHSSDKVLSPLLVSSHFYPPINALHSHITQPQQLPDCYIYSHYGRARFCTDGNVTRPRAFLYRCQTDGDMVVVDWCLLQSPQLQVIVFLDPPEYKQSPLFYPSDVCMWRYMVGVCNGRLAAYTLGHLPQELPQSVCTEQFFFFLSTTL